MHDLLFDFISKYISLTDDEKNAIVSLDVFRSFKKGATLLKEGQKSNDGYFVLKGCIRTYYIIGGDEKTTAFYTEMEALTPHCIINKAPSEYYISCVEDTILIVSTLIWKLKCLVSFRSLKAFAEYWQKNFWLNNKLILMSLRLLHPNNGI